MIVNLTIEQLNTLIELVRIETSRLTNDQGAARDQLDSIYDRLTIARAEFEEEARG